MTLNEEITTIFVVGFPDDMKEREFVNLFLFAPDFEGAVLKVPNLFNATYVPPNGQLGGMVMSELSFQSDAEAVDNLTDGVSRIGAFSDIWPSFLDRRRAPQSKKQIIGFARFRSQAAALHAIEILGGKKIDPERSQLVMKAELAKKNLVPKRPSLGLSSSYISSPTDADKPRSLFSDLRTDTLDLFDQAYHFKMAEFDDPTVTGSLSIDGCIQEDWDVVGHSKVSLAINPPARKDHGSFDLYLKDSPPRSFSEGSRPEPFSRTYSLDSGLKRPLRNSFLFSIGENPPCNTLYVGNLPSNVSEEELRSLFYLYPGYKRLSFKIKSNGPMCFVEFDNIICATNAMNELYGTMLSSSTKGGIRLSYSKNPLGVRPPGFRHGYSGSGGYESGTHHINQDDGSRQDGPFYNSASLLPFPRPL